MISYQIAAFLIMAAIIGGVLLMAFIDEISKNRKAKKQYVKGLELEKKNLERKVQAMKLMAELKGGGFTCLNAETAMQHLKPR